MLTIPRAPLWRAFACYTLLAGLDLGLTMRVLRAGGVEWNPLEGALWHGGHLPPQSALPFRDVPGRLPGGGAARRTQWESAVATRAL